VIRAETPPLAAHSQHALEARFGLRVAAALSEQPVGRDIEERLRFARELALARAGAAGRDRAGPTVVAAGGAAALGYWGLRVASWLPLIVLALGLVFVERVDREERIRAAADIDAVLLADELPPGAYADPGFTEYLKRAEP
jgi:hypothetical protein